MLGFLAGVFASPHPGHQKSLTTTYLKGHQSPKIMVVVVCWMTGRMISLCKAETLGWVGGWGRIVTVKATRGSSGTPGNNLRLLIVAIKTLHE